ncbi:multicopper oxidase domain-containing protein [Thermoactinomyces sp. CICC 10523]
MYIQMTAQVTKLKIAPGIIHQAWTFNGTVPGPILKVNQGDTLHISFKNLDPNMPHSVDFHAVNASPSKNFANVLPNKSGEFVYTTDTPGIFMYHCDTEPVLEHVANGMFGMIIVKPKSGYPTDNQVDRTFTLIQSEWYDESNSNSLQNGTPQAVVFNGKDFSMQKPLAARNGERIRLEIVNAGPNHFSAFHVIGAVFDRVYLNGNPADMLHGQQTVTIPPGGSAIVEFVVKEKGDYPIISHSLMDMQKGAKIILHAE